jgi:hypothetical protein
MGGSNDLENSEDCRSAGGHGNQHVRLRCAQINRIETICPAPEAILLSSRGRPPHQNVRIADPAAVFEALALHSSSLLTGLVERLPVGGTASNVFGVEKQSSGPPSAKLAKSAAAA